jgi:hypothetical protein
MLTQNKKTSRKSFVFLVHLPISLMLWNGMKKKCNSKNAQLSKKNTEKFASEVSPVTKTVQSIDYQHRS